MSAIHDLSCATPLREFDIFDVPPTQAAVEQDILTEHRPISTLDSKSNIEFSLSSAVDEYIRLDKTCLYIKLRIHIRKPLNLEIKIEDWNDVSIVNNFLNSLFKQIDFVIGDKLVSQSNHTYPYKTDFEIKLGKSSEAKNTYLTSGIWYDDNEDDLDGINNKRQEFIKPTGTDKNDNLSQGKELDLIGKIYLPMFEQKKALLGGCKLRLKFIPNNPEFYMMAKPTVRVKYVEFLDAALYVHRSKVTKPVLAGVTTGLNVGNARYPIRESFVIPITISKGIVDTIIDNVHNGQLPKRAFVAFVDNNAFNGSYALNPFNYQNFNLSYLAFHLNGIQYPEQAFTPNFEKNIYVKEYLSLFEATNQDETNSCIKFDRKNFVKGNNIFAVNFSPDLSSGCCATGYANPIKYGSLRLQVKFKQALEKTITALIYMDYDSILEINSDRNAIYEPI